MVLRIFLGEGSLVNEGHQGSERNCKDIGGLCGDRCFNSCIILESFYDSMSLINL